MYGDNGQNECVYKSSGYLSLGHIHISLTNLHVAELVSLCATTKLCRWRVYMRTSNRSFCRISMNTRLLTVDPWQIASNFEEHKHEWLLTQIHFFDSILHIMAYDMVIWWYMIEVCLCIFIYILYLQFHFCNTQQDLCMINYRQRINTEVMFSLLLGSCRWLINWRVNAVRVCGLRGDVAHLTPPASCLLHARQLQQLFGISRSAITACEYYCTTQIMRHSCCSARSVQNFTCRIWSAQMNTKMHWICRCRFTHFQATQQLAHLHKL